MLFISLILKDDPSISPTEALVSASRLVGVPMYVCLLSFTVLFPLLGLERQKGGKEEKEMWRDSD